MTGWKDGSVTRLPEATPAPGRSRMSDELMAALRARIQDRYYEQPHVLEIIAQAILHSRGLYL